MLVSPIDRALETDIPAPLGGGYSAGVTQVVWITGVLAAVTRYSRGPMSQRPNVSSCRSEKATPSILRALPVVLGLAILAPALAGCGSSDPDTVEWNESFDASQIGWFMNVWGPAENDLYAVGGSPSAGVIMRFDGAAWTPFEIGFDVPLVTWIHGFGSDDMTAVGFGGTAMHWNGSTWTLQETPTEEDLWGVWGFSSDDLWAVGGSGRSDSEATLLHFDGDAWTAVEVPTLERANVFAFFKVFGTSADNAYVVGQRGAVLHWDGQVWTEELVGASDDLVSMWGTGPDNLVAVGGRANGIISIWNGSEWRTESLAPIPGLNGIWMQEPGVVHAVGTFGTLLEIELDSLEVSESSLSTGLDFHAVFSATGTTLVAVGGNLTVPGSTFEGIAFQRDL